MGKLGGYKYFSPGAKASQSIRSKDIDRIKFDEGKGPIQDKDKGPIRDLAAALESASHTPAKAQTRATKSSSIGSGNKVDLTQHNQQQNNATAKGNTVQGVGAVNTKIEKIVCCEKCIIM